MEYWDESGMDRLEFLRLILRRLDQQGWPSKVDSGWSEFDVEIFGSRWAHLQLATVTEGHGSNRQLLRCRLRTIWSLLANIAFWSMLGFELLVIGFVGSVIPWLWFLLLTLPLFVWFLEQEQRDLQRLIVVLLDEVAKQKQLHKVIRPLTEESAPA